MGPMSGRLPPIPTGARNDRVSLRRSDLKKLARYSESYDPSCSLETNLDGYVADIARRAGGIDPYNPELLPPQMLGVVLGLTLKQKMAVEDAATAYGLSQGWRRSDGKQYYCRLRTVAPCDVTSDESERAYRQRRNKAGAVRRAEALLQAKMNATSGEQTIQRSFSTYREDVRAQKTQTAARTEVLFDAIGAATTVDSLTRAVRYDRSWLDHDRKPMSDEKLRKTIRDRLDTLRAAGRIVDSYRPGPRGSRIRVVRRV